MTSASTGPSELTVSAVICAYTDARRELLDASVEAVLDQLRPGDQLVVVIDHNDELLNRVSAKYGARATVVPNSNDRGLSGARNAGIAASVGSVVAFIDDDARVDPGSPGWAATHGRCGPMTSGRAGSRRNSIGSSAVVIGGCRWNPRRYATCWAATCRFAGTPWIQPAASALRSAGSDTSATPS